ncbi:hypothetical protein ACSV5M_13165 [Cellvibrio sp. ARAG 10.3]|uniref:hypothetical protein n=1 Tax=Cellvibrio sp. ARAG 10.3 TaxID=3451358 RepID=UPI003F4693A8
MTIVQSPQSWIKHTFFIGIIAALTACGGSGGGGGKEPPMAPPDTTPNAFTIPAEQDVEPGEEVISEAVTINGINRPTPISIVGGEYSINGATYTSAEGTINNNQSVTVKLVAPEATNETGEATLTIGGVSATFSIATIIDNTPPSVTITFPPAVSLTEGTTILVRGTASDELNAVESVEVNGLAATSDDGYATWAAEVTLEPGVENVLNVTARDSVGSEGDNLASVTVRHSVDLNIAFPDDQVQFSAPQTVAVDAERNQALVVDVEQRAIYAVDLATGIRSILSENKEGDEFPLLLERTDFNYAGIAVDSENGVAYVGSSTESALTSGPTVLSVNLETGARDAGSQHATSRVSHLAFSADADRIYFGSFQNGAFLALDPIAKEYEFVSWSSNNIPVDGENPLTSVGAIAVDNMRNRALVTTATGEQLVMAIDLSEENPGVRTPFSTASIPNTDNLFTASGNHVLTSITVDAANDRALMVDRGLDAIFSLALGGEEEGARTILSDADTPNALNTLLDPTSVYVEEGMTYGLVVDKERKALMAIDLVNGQRVVLSKSAVSPP